MLVTSIITRLPPAVDGVGDYALNVALRLRKDFDLETHFVVGDPTWTGATKIEGFLIHPVSAPKRSPAANHSPAALRQLWLCQAGLSCLASGWLATLAEC